jgi:nucleoside-diphosphate-sugar epimerase
MAVHGVYDQHVTNVERIIRIASPVPFPTEDPHCDIVIPSVCGIENIPSATRNLESLKTLVITSSLSAIPPINTSGILRDQGPQLLFSNSGATEVSNIHELGPIDAPTAYAAGKAKGLQAIESFVAFEVSYNFDITIILPGYVFGPDMRAAKRPEYLSISNTLLLNLILY